jgi:hypothetical protein
MNGSVVLLFYIYACYNFTLRSVSPAGLQRSEDSAVGFSRWTFSDYTTCTLDNGAQGCALFLFGALLG